MAGAGAVGDAARKAPRFVAIIDHQDDDALLAVAVRHHLEIGVARVFVRARGGSPGPNVGDDPRVEILAGAAEAEGFGNLTDVAHHVAQLTDPDWILFVETDDYWLPEGRRLADIEGLGDADLLAVERYVTPLLREQDGTLTAPDLSHPYDLPLIVERERIEDEYEAGEGRTPWTMWHEAPRFMVRPAMIDALGLHAAKGRRLPPDVRRLEPKDLIILHAPFTTQTRFRNKVAAVRHLGPGHDWPWRHWLSLADAELGPAFEHEALRAKSVPALIRQGVMTSAAAELFSDQRNKEAEPIGAASSDSPGRLSESPRAPAPAAPDVRPPAHSSLNYAPERQITNAEECYFFHSMTLPDHGEVIGQWDLRGNESAYLGGVDFNGRSVLEVRPASGHLSFWMERQGADVTSFDIDEHQSWDLVPFAKGGDAATMADRKASTRLVNNSWWFTRAKMKGRARVIYDTVYHLDALPATFDIVTFNTVLLHLRDPFLALSKAAARTRDKIIVTDIALDYFLGHDATADPHSMYFIPRDAAQGPTDAWWCVPEQLTAEFLRILGFRDIVVSHHRQTFMVEQKCQLYTIVGTR